MINRPSTSYKPGHQNRHRYRGKKIRNRNVRILILDYLYIGPIPGEGGAQTAYDHA